MQPIPDIQGKTYTFRFEKQLSAYINTHMECRRYGHIHTYIPMISKISIKPRPGDRIDNPTGTGIMFRQIA